MAGKAVVRGVDLSAGAALRIRRIPLQDRVPFRFPVELLRPRRPVRLASVQRLRPDGGVVDVRVLLEFAGRRERTVFLKLRVALACHERGFYARPSSSPVRAVAGYGGRPGST